MSPVSTHLSSSAGRDIGWRLRKSRLTKLKTLVYHSSSCQSLEIAHIFQTDRDVRSIYTREMTVLSALVEEARQRYNKTSKQYLTIYSVDSEGLNLSPLHITISHYSSQITDQDHCGIMSRPSSDVRSALSFWREALLTHSLTTLMSFLIWENGTQTQEYRIAGDISYMAHLAQGRVCD